MKDQIVRAPLAWDFGKRAGQRPTVVVVGGRRRRMNNSGASAPEPPPSPPGGSGEWLQRHSRYTQSPSAQATAVPRSVKALRLKRPSPLRGAPPFKSSLPWQPCGTAYAKYLTFLEGQFLCRLTSLQPKISLSLLTTISPSSPMCWFLSEICAWRDWFFVLFNL